MAAGTRRADADQIESSNLGNIFKRFVTSRSLGNTHSPPTESKLSELMDKSGIDLLQRVAFVTEIKSTFDSLPDNFFFKSFQQGATQFA
jgi:hypothetical protein